MHVPRVGNSNLMHVLMTCKLPCDEPRTVSTSAIAASSKNKYQIYQVLTKHLNFY